MKSLNCTGFSKKKNSETFHVNSAFTRTGFSKLKKKTVHFSEQLQWSHAPLLLFFPDEKQQNAASSKPAVPCGSYPLKVFLF